MPIALPENGLVSMADAISKLSPVFLGSGATTSKETSSSSGTAPLQGIIDAANANSNNPMGNLGPVIQQIMDAATRAFAPTLAQQNSAGMYSSNVLSMLSAMAQGEAVKQSAQTIAEYKTAQQKIATTAAGELANSTRSTTGTKQTAPTVNPLSSLMGIGGLVAASKLGLIGNSSSPGPLAGISAFVKNKLGLGDAAPATQYAGSQDFIGALNTPGGLPAGGGDAFAAAGPDITSTASDSVSSVLPDLATTAIDSGGAAGGFSIADAADATAPIADAASSAGGDVVDAASAGWVVCTELLHQGRLPRRYYYHGAKRFAGYWEYGKRGYYIWAIPSVRHLRRYPKSNYSLLLCAIFNWRAEYLASCAGVSGARPLIRGRVVSVVLWAVCATLAVTLCQFVKCENWQHLEGERA